MLINEERVAVLFPGLGKQFVERDGVESRLCRKRLSQQQTKQDGGNRQLDMRDDARGHCGVWATSIVDAAAFLCFDLCRMSHWLTIYRNQLPLSIHFPN